MRLHSEHAYCPQVYESELASTIKLNVVNQKWKMFTDAILDGSKVWQERSGYISWWCHRFETDTLVGIVFVQLHWNCSIGYLVTLTSMNPYSHDAKDVAFTLLDK